MLLEDEEWGAGADREIARRCAVSNDFVSRLRASLSSDDSEPAPRTYQDRHGNVTRMDTARIGRKAAEPAPSAAAEAEAAALPHAPEALPTPALFGLTYTPPVASDGKKGMRAAKRSSR